jgi:hypothetical protein
VDAKIGASRREVGSQARTVLVAGGLLAAFALVAQAGAHISNYAFFDMGISHLDADVDGNALTWASSLATLCAAAFALMLARLLPARRKLLTALGVLLAFFAADDAFGIHENLGSGFASVGLPDIAGIWFPVYLPLFGFCAAVLWTVGSPERRVVTMARLGVLLLGAAIAGEALTAVVPALERTDATWLYELEVALEEAAELAGWIAIASALGAADVIARQAVHPDQAGALESPSASAAV